MAHADQFTREALMSLAVKNLVDRLAAEHGVPAAPAEGIVPLTAEATDVDDLSSKSIVAGGPTP